jgi:dolichol kinase
VWGLGDVNRKSVAGTWAAFLGALGLGIAVVVSHGLPASWLLLAFVIAVSNTLLELFSPRGTDDFTMATANALICLLFGILVY